MTYLSLRKKMDLQVPTPGQRIQFEKQDFIKII
jgi:hypothetical protein